MRCLRARRVNSKVPPVRISPDVHTEAVQAALAKHKERKMAVPMPSKRRSLVVQTSMDTYTPPGTQVQVNEDETWRLEHLGLVSGQIGVVLDKTGPVVHVIRSRTAFLWCSLMFFDVL